MLRTLSDQNFNGRILRAMRRRLPALDLVRATDVGLGEAEDPVLLEWAAAQGRVLLTHDVNTIPGFATARIQAGQPMPGVLLVPKSMPIGRAIDELMFVVQEASPQDCLDQVTYFPF